MSSPAIESASEHPARFQRGNTAWRAKRDRVQARYEQLLAEYDAQTATQRSLLRVVAQHLDDAERTRSATSRVRSSHAATRILKGIPRKRAPIPSLASYKRKAGK